MTTDSAYPIHLILMERDGISIHEAKQIVADAKIALQYYLDHDMQEDAYEICGEFFCLEPDYLVQLL